MRILPKMTLVVSLAALLLLVPVLTSTGDSAEEPPLAEIVIGLPPADLAPEDPLVISEEKDIFSPDDGLILIGLTWNFEERTVESARSASSWSRPTASCRRRVPPEVKPEMAETPVTFYWYMEAAPVSVPGDWKTTHYLDGDEVGEKGFEMRPSGE